MEEAQGRGREPHIADVPIMDKFPVETSQRGEVIGGSTNGRSFEN
jgi:hypothetical protein